VKNTGQVTINWSMSALIGDLLPGKLNAKHLRFAHNQQ